MKWCFKTKDSRSPKVKLDILYLHFVLYASCDPHLLYPLPQLGPPVRGTVQQPPATDTTPLLPLGGGTAAHQQQVVGGVVRHASHTLREVAGEGEAVELH